MKGVGSPFIGQPWATRWLPEAASIVNQAVATAAAGRRCAVHRVLLYRDITNRQIPDLTELTRLIHDVGGYGLADVA
jgi:hypothetical protein